MAVDVLRLALGVTGMSGRYELGAPDTLPPPGSLRSGADVRDLATRTNSEYAFVVQVGRRVGRKVVLGEGWRGVGCRAGYGHECA